MNNMQDILKNYYANGGRELFESRENLEEDLADKVKGAILGAAITFAAVNTDLDKVFVQPDSSSNYTATAKPTNNTVAVVDPDTKEVKRVEPKVKTVSTKRVDYVMKSMTSADPKMLDFGIDGDSLIIKIDGSIYKGYNAYLTSVKQGRQRDRNISNAFEYYGFNEKDILDKLNREHSLFGLESGIKRVKFSTNVDINKYKFNTSNDADTKQEAPSYLTRRGDKGKYKIVSAKQSDIQPEVTVVLSMRRNADKTISYTLRGIDVWGQKTYEVPAGITNTSDDYEEMKRAFRKGDYILGFTGVDIKPGSIQAMLRQGLIKMDKAYKADTRNTKSSKDIDKVNQTTSVRAYKDAIAKRDSIKS